MPADAGPARSRPILEVRHVTISFGSVPVLRDVSFDVLEGSSMVLLGPNGSGKTVLFRALIGAIPCEGSIRWAAGVRIGYVPQKLDLERDVPITGLDFLRARPSKERPAPGDIEHFLAEVGLSHEVVGRSIGALSGGQFQRLLVAFALVGRPNVLLLDEATAGVDEPGQERLYELLHRLQLERRLTIMSISHELSIVSGHVSSVVCLGGKGAWCGPPKELTDKVLQTMYGVPLALHVHER
jgi:zinc transport system ATP-binding protein